MNIKKPKLDIHLLALSLALGQVCLPITAALAEDNQVRLAGQVVISDIAPASNLSAEQRADAIQKNLDNALVAAKSTEPGAVAVTYTKGIPIVTVGGYQVATADGASARAAHTTTTLLAKRWADSLRTALRDQQSVQAYVAQLSGTYQSSAPSVIATAPPKARSADQIAQANAMQSPGYDQQSQDLQQSAPNVSNPPVNPQGLQPGMIQGIQPAQNMPPNAMQGIPPVRQARVVYAPAGMVVSAMLQSSISSEVARPGDIIEAQINQPIILGDSQIPAGSTVIGQVSDATNGKMLGRSGSLQVRFNRLRTPDGQEVPVTAHLMGGIGKYKDIGGDRSDTFKGETWKGKVAQAGIRGLIGAGTGAALGTAVGAIAGGRHGLGRGAWSGTAIGGGVGLADSLILRKGQNVNITSGTQIQLQLDAPLQFAGTPSTELHVYGGTYSP